jgi:hypothetical protein
MTVSHFWRESLPLRNSHNQVEQRTNTSRAVKEPVNTRETGLVLLSIVPLPSSSSPPPPLPPNKHPRYPLLPILPLLSPPLSLLQREERRGRRERSEEREEGDRGRGRE